jgi:hypothetical protein
MVCQAWAIQGYGTPVPIYVIYILKVLLYVAGWCFFVSFTEGMGDPRTIGSWWFTSVAFQKAVLWSMAFEGLGLGCGSGPLTGRYSPPIGGFLYFLRPGAIKLPLFPGVPLLGRSQRGFVDIALYVAHYAFLVRALLAPELGFELLLPIAILLPLLGLADKTLFLIARGEHFYTALICFLFAADWVPGTKLVWLAVWLWAATSKLTRHFPTVVCVMTSNSPFTKRLVGLRKRMYRSYPGDLRPSRLAVIMSHTGTALEYLFPLLLVTNTGGPVTTFALVTMLGFHFFITSNIPMGVPIEWNVLMVYGGFVLFGHHAAVSAFAVGSPLLLTFLVAMLVAVPLFGSFVPSRVSFLCSMRYYAGNWPYGVWLFRGESSRKLDEGLVKSAARVPDQLRKMYDEETVAAVVSKVVAWRAMHLQGRALQLLLPKAVEDIEAYEYVDGELVASVALGWNFGDGHLHNEQLLASIQERCNFAEGELRCVFIESQPLFGTKMAWRIVDAKAGVMQRGEVDVRELEKLQPWPVPEAAGAP